MDAWEARAWSCHAMTTVVRKNPDGSPGTDVVAECAGSGQTDIAECERRARLIASAPDHALVAWALADATARWEPWDDAGRGELCFGGLRYATRLDAFGVPALTEALRVGLTKARSVRIKAAAILEDCGTDAEARRQALATGQYGIDEGRRG